MWKLIEQFIINNRSEIDLDEPDDRVWEHIEKVLDQKPNKKSLNLTVRNSSLWKVAAAIIFVAGLGSTLFMNFHRNDDLYLKSLQTSLLEWDQHHSYPELSKQDSAYAVIAQQLIRKINGYELDSFSFVSPYRKQLDKLGKRFDELKLTFNEKGYSEELQEEIDKTFKQKIELLERLLLELENSREK